MLLTLADARIPEAALATGENWFKEYSSIPSMSKMLNIHRILGGVLGQESICGWWSLEPDLQLVTKSSVSSALQLHIQKRLTPNMEIWQFGKKQDK